jgi:hypothetical protein
MERKMSYFKISHGAFFDTRVHAIAKAGHIHVKGAEHRDDYLRRLASCGCTDGSFVELSAPEYRAVVLAQFPQLAK